ncbi:MAG: helix-turn-helix transcriptional regulator [Candidatus Omnitrophica bacterium]|nr:helix-turn-helix transcriptional regulator [Candidatus Omnitrophota bacterium]
MDGAEAEVREKIQQLTVVRRRLGWSEEVCAYHLGVTYSTLNRWERGESFPKSRVVLKAIDHFIARYGKAQAERG